MQPYIICCWKNFNNISLPLFYQLQAVCYYVVHLCDIVPSALAVQSIKARLDPFVLNLRTSLTSLSMSKIPGETLKPWHGAQELDLPDNAKKRLLAIKTAVQNESPELRTKSNEKWYQYKTFPECEPLLKEILENKVST
jgi:hypothetical protein